MKIALLLCLLGAAGGAGAAPVTMPLTPDASRIGCTVFVLGVWPVHADFAAFAGRLTADPAHPAACSAWIAVRLASLRTNYPAATPLALGASLLDAAAFPMMRFQGACRAGRVEGMLTLHGVTHPLAFAMRRTGLSVSVSGIVQRQDYGVAGFPGLVAPGVRCELQTTLPPAFIAVP